MAYIREKKTKSDGYYYLVESHRVNGKVIKEETYLGTKRPIAKSRLLLNIKVPKLDGGYERVAVEPRVKKIDLPLCSECEKLLDTLEVGQEFNWCPECEAEQLALLGKQRIAND